MRKVAICFSLLILASCSGDMKSSLGIRKSSPDEFTVISRSHLSVPPVLYLDDKQKSTQVNLENKAKKNFTKSEETFLMKLSTQDSNPNIRNQINSDNQAKLEENKSKGSIRKLFDKMSGEKKDKVVEPIGERDRIKQNLAEGNAINEGDIPEKNMDKSPLKKLLE